ncbi:hypothetical protein H4219_003841 [Mycoemilia scoparia]|uniref:Uncharacterized protein n=1 Tax=Mycoemilia scoparia TaxID=417184 RepID=A0A9W7ZTJ1_9FUNG|nr:hypothetical protein H4219_003841 [Mycoemilia scoparia]
MTEELKTIYLTEYLETLLLQLSSNNNSDNNQNNNNGEVYKIKEKLWQDKIIDLRSISDYKKAHLTMSMSFPWVVKDEQDEDRFFEFPPKNTSITLVLDEYSDNVTKVARRIGGRRWPVKQVIIWNIKNDGSLTEGGSVSQKYQRLIDAKGLIFSNDNNCPSGQNGEKEPVVMMCQPANFMSSTIDSIESELLLLSLSKPSEPIRPDTLTVKSTVCRYWKALDIGCGSGRDIAFLALRGLQNNNDGTAPNSAGYCWDITGLDNLSSCVKRCNSYAQRLGVSTRMRAIQTSAINIEPPQQHSQKVNTHGNTYNTQPSPIPQHPHPQKEKEEGFLLENCPNFYDLVTIIRFLCRPEFEKIDRCIKPGGFIMISTFVDLEPDERNAGAINAKQPDGKIEAKKPASPHLRLKQNELKSWWCGVKGYKVFSDIIENTEDGRPLNSFLAQKPAPTKDPQVLG